MANYRRMNDEGLQYLAMHTVNALETERALTYGSQSAIRMFQRRLEKIGAEQERRRQVLNNTYARRTW